MKKLILILLIAFSITACKNTNEANINKTETNVSSSNYQIDAENIFVNWVGFKFTEKTPVKGQFKQVNLTNSESGSTINEAINGAVFSIPITSLFSNDNTRDEKLKSLFFGSMENTELLKGKITSVNNDTGVVAITMNNETHDLPFIIKKEENKAILNATLDINQWNANKALETLHKACEVLHTGSDGVSKTWNTVDIEVVLNFKSY